LEDTLDKVCDLVQIPLEGLHDKFMHEKSSSLGFDDTILSNPLDHSHASSFCSLPSHSPEYYIDTRIENLMIFGANVDLGSMNNMFNMLGGNVDNFHSLGYFCGYDASVDPYCILLVDKHRKIVWNAFFAFSFDFSMALALLKRAITFFVVIIFMLSYCHAWKLYVEEFDRLLRALMILI